MSVWGPPLCLTCIPSTRHKKKQKKIYINPLSIFKRKNEEESSIPVNNNPLSITSLANLGPPLCLTCIPSNAAKSIAKGRRNRSESH